MAQPGQDPVLDREYEQSVPLGDKERMKVANTTSMNDLLRHKEFKRFLRFLAVGLSGTVLDFAILTVLKTVFGVPTLIANTISYSAGVINNFTWNRLWTFSEARDKHWAIQFSQFVVINVIGLLLNNLIVVTLEHPLGRMLHVPNQGYLLAKLVATGVVVVYNFLANRLWTFREVSRPA